MRKFWPLFLFIVAIAPAQQKPKSALEDSAAFLKAGWQRLYGESKKATKTWPQRITHLRTQLSDITIKSSKVAGMKMEEKKALITQLWQIRESLDLLTLMDPQVLKAVTGIDTRGLHRMWADVRKIESSLRR